jgi:hypothetical protein
MAVLIGHARSSEAGSKYGAAGDQTGREVSISEWYSAGWQYVFRPKYEALAAILTEVMTDACFNDHVGYSQKDRETLEEQAKRVNYDVSAITKNVNCDCSSLIAVCCRAADLNVPAGMYTGNEYKCLNQTGAFDVLTEEKYISGCHYLKAGDILLKPGHTAMALTPDITGIKVNKKYWGLYGAKTAVNLRTDVKGKILCSVPFGNVLIGYGIYKSDPDTGRFWIYGTFNNKIGFSSVKYYETIS